MKKDTNISKSKIFDQYIQLVLLSSENGVVKSTARELLEKQGETLGLNENERNVLEACALNSAVMRIDPKDIYASLLSEYINSYTLFEKQQIIKKMDAVDCLEEVKLKYEIDALGTTVLEDYKQILESMTPNETYNVQEYLLQPKQMLREDVFQVKEKVLDELLNRLNKCIEIRRIRTEAALKEDVEIGPTVIRFKIRLLPGERLSKLQGAIEDIGRELESLSTPLVGNVSSTNFVYIDIPQANRRPVPFFPCLNHPKFSKNTDPNTLRFFVGLTTTGQAYFADLLQTQHLLIAGTTGSGKSVFLKGMLASLVIKHPPDNLRLMIIDTKNLDFSIYQDLPHLDPLNTIVHDPGLARKLILGLTKEIDRRKRKIKGIATTLESYNKKVRKEEKIPYFVVIVDEYADLVSRMEKNERCEFEQGMCRIAQVARALGIRMVISTQRPDATTVTSLLKANFPTRIAFVVADHHNSQIIIESSGAENLLGKGDLLFSMDGRPCERLQSAFISEDDMKSLIQIAAPYSCTSNSVFTQESLEKINPYTYNTFPYSSAPGLRLRPNEICFVEFNAYLHEERAGRQGKSTRVGVGGGSGGLGAGVSQGGFESVSVPILTYIDTVKIFITNQRFVFLGDMTGGEINFLDIIDFINNETRFNLYVGKRQKAYCFHYYKPQEHGFFENVCSIFGFGPEQVYIPAGKGIPHNILEELLSALIYLSRDPGLINVEFSTRNNVCLAKLKENGSDWLN